jgi:predicted DNA-binding transcriptional regulator AlpA
MKPSVEGSPLTAAPAHHVFLSALEVIARYGWGRTKGYRILRSDGFPRPIGGDRYRLDALMAWEEEQLTVPLRPRPAILLPPRRRRTAHSA